MSTIVLTFSKLLSYLVVLLVTLTYRKGIVALNDVINYVT